MNRLNHIDALRGIASLMVCWFHMTQGGKLLGEGVLSRVSSLGFLGVEVFFVISGFVIPYSVARSKYQLRDFWTFMRKRLIRVHPPFLAACLLAIMLNLISISIPGYAGGLDGNYPIHALCSFFRDGLYLSGVMGYPWILVVAWTLAIEVQFYIVAGILLPWMAPHRPWILSTGLVLLSLLTFTHVASCWLLPYLAYFTLGWSIAWLKLGGRAAGWICAATSVCVVLYSTTLSTTLAAVIAGLWIHYWKRPFCSSFTWLGTVSYSLYLIHVPIGGRVVNLGGRLADNTWHYLLMAIIGASLSLVVAWMFWRLIELPFHRLSRRWTSSRKSSQTASDEAC